jgi:hypothetical protein
MRGQVTDESGGAIVGAKVTLTDWPGAERTIVTDGAGVYAFDELPPGKYTLRVEATGFATYANTSVEVRRGRRQALDIQLKVTLKDEITVGDERPLTVDPDNNASAVILHGRTLDMLPENPEALAAALQGLAAATGGSGGGQIIVDGFPGGRLPPKDTIREIRINQNPYAAEFARPGNSRIEVFTKAGTNTFHGAAFFNFNDESLNSRNPFTLTRAPYQTRFYGGRLSGPLPGKRASFFLNLSRYEDDGNAVINAIVLDPGLNVARLSQAVLTPSRSTTFNPRFDFRVNNNHTFVARYNLDDAHSENQGIGEFSLLSRAYSTSRTEHTLQLTETAVLSKNAVNEARFQYVRERRRQEGDNSVATLRVLEAFTGGGSQIGLSSVGTDRLILQNNTTRVSGRHTLRFGGQLRYVNIQDVSPNNFGGTYTFGGGLAPQLDASNRPVLDTNGQPVLVPITSIERYRRTLQLRGQGLPPAASRALGGGATQFSIAGGEPGIEVSQVDLGVFTQDDWRLRPNLSLSLGLRYETQSNISSNLNFAPRVSVGWSPRGGGKRPPLAVIRAGAGIFYERFGESYTLQARRYNGITQQQFVVSDPAVLDLFPQVPSVDALIAFAVPQTIKRVSETTQTPYTIRSSLSIERQLPYNFTLSVSLTNSRTLHALRSRNVNAPLPGTFIPGALNSGVGNVFEFESSGVFNQRQLAIHASNNIGSNLSFFATYILGRALSDTDGAGSFPADSYDLRAEYGRSAADIRHQFYFGGSIITPQDIFISPYLIIHSGMPFDITTGRDANGDALFTERPAFATDLTRPGVVVTPFGAFDPTPSASQAIIPRNYGQGPGFITLNMFASKTFSFDGSLRRGNTVKAASAGEAAERFYKVILSVQMQNLFNHTTLGSPIGNLSSPFFGQSNWNAGDYGFGGGNPAGNRRIEAQIRFSF